MTRITQEKLFKQAGLVSIFWIFLSWHFHFQAIAQDDEERPIGKIVLVDQKEDAPISIENKSRSKRAACRGCPVFETDVITTDKKQSLSLQMNEGTELGIGPSSRVSLESWNERNSKGFLRRLLSLFYGNLRATVKKVYSDDEPFLVRTKDSIMGVRGTEFVILTSIERVDRFERAMTVNLYTLSGEVHFAKSEEDLNSGNYVKALPGYFSQYHPSLSRPTMPQKFEPSKLESLLKTVLPKSAEKVQIQQQTYRTREENVLSLMQPQRSQAKPDSEPAKGYPLRRPHTAEREDSQESKLTTITSNAESAKAYRRSKESAVKEESAYEQNLKTFGNINSGYDPRSRSYNPMRKNNPSNPSQTQLIQPRRRAHSQVRDLRLKSGGGASQIVNEQGPNR